MANEKKTTAMQAYELTVSDEKKAGEELDAARGRFEAARLKRREAWQLVKEEAKASGKPTPSGE